MITKLRVGIIDFGGGNLISIINAVERLLHDVSIVNSPSDFEGIDCLIIPGVGSFAAAMYELKFKGLIHPIINFSINKSILGICLGFQVFASLGYEGSETRGLNLFNASVKRFNISLPVPHVGWNSVTVNKDAKLFHGIENGNDFYFTHSYYVDVDDKNIVIGTTEYELEFASCVIHNQIVGVQFHPEKSGSNGSKLLENFFKYYVKN